MFAYCNNNPVNYEDPTGNRPQYFPILVNDDLYYIHDQMDQSIVSLPYGDSTIGEMGCGVVATYNALLDMGKFTSFEDVYEWYLGHLSWLNSNGKTGVFIGTVAAFFSEHGYDTTILISCSPEVHQEYAQTADACIMLYRYKTSEGRNGHYVAYSWSGQHFIGRNTTGGIATFTSPWDYGTQGTRYFVYEVFVFERKG